MSSQGALRAIAYVRVSVVGDRAKRGRFESPELQREAIDAWCARNNASVVREVRDLNRSGGTLTRPGLQQALEVIGAGEADGIVVARSDRASRRTIDGLGLIDALEQRGAWIAAADGTIDTTDRVARMATTMMFAVGQHELDRFREQAAEVHRRAIVEKGRHMGPAPFGYARDDDGRLRVDPERAPFVRMIFERRADGAGWSALARELEQAGARLASGTRLSTTQLPRIVKRRVYLGEAKHGQWVRQSAHEAIVDEGLWAAANHRPAVAADPAFSGRAHPLSPLRGLLRCAGCRYALKRLPATRGKEPRWSCRSVTSDRASGHTCPAPARLTGRQAAAVHELVAERFFALAGDPLWQEVSPDADVPALARAAGDAEALLDELSQLDVRRQLGAARWSRMVAEARADAEAKREAAARARSRATPTGDVATLRAAWEAASLEDRGELLRSIVQAVMVVSGDSPVEGRLHLVPVWDDVELPVKGAGGFAAGPWQPSAAASAGENARADAPEIG